MTYEEFLTRPLEDLRDAAELGEVLGLSGQAPSEHAREALRIDYKSVDFGDDIAKHVAAFANTAGGHIFLGVAEKDQLPTHLAGFQRHGELRPQLENAIRGRVDRPVSLDIRAFPLPNTHERQVAVIRIPVVRTLPVRFASKDSNQPGWRVVKRTDAGQSIDATDSEILDLHSPLLDANQLTAQVERIAQLEDRCWCGLIINPIRSVGNPRIKLDGRDDDAFRDLVQKSFWWDFTRPTARVDPHGTFSEVSGSIDVSARWLSFDNGTIAHVRVLEKDAPFSLFSAAFEMLQLIDVARQWLGYRWGYWGETELVSIWDTPSRVDVRWFAAPNRKFDCNFVPICPAPMTVSPRSLDWHDVKIRYSRGYRDSIADTCVFRLGISNTYVTASFLNDHLRNRGFSVELPDIQANLIRWWQAVQPGRSSQRYFVPPWSGGVPIGT